MVEIYDGFFRDIPDALFVDGFKDHFRLKGVTMTPERVRCEKLFLLLDSGFAQGAAQLAAIRGFYLNLRDPKIEQILLNEYGFSIFNYYQLTGTAGYGHCWLQAMNQVKPSLSEIWKAAKHHWRDNRIFKLTKRVVRKLRLVSG
jgi:hypothetical protein